MVHWLALFWGICRGKKKPQDIPFSIQVFWVLLCLGMVLDIVNLNLNFVEIEAGWAVITAVSLTVIHYSILALFITLMGFANRLNQALNSILGSSLILGLMTVPLYLLVEINVESSRLLYILLFALNIWMLFVLAHILRHTLSVAYPIGFILSIGFFMLNMMIGNWFLADLITDAAIETTQQYEIK